MFWRDLLPFMLIQKGGRAWQGSCTPRSDYSLCRIVRCLALRMNRAVIIQKTIEVRRLPANAGRWGVA